MAVWVQGEITLLLNRGGSSPDQDREQLATLVYAELRRIAAQVMSTERQSHTLQATVLATDAFLGLLDQGRQWENRTHFFAVAARAMRRVLVDHSRRKKSLKRGGDNPHVELSESLLLPVRDFETLLALDRALTRLEAFDARQVQIVELRYFGGLTEDETAEVLRTPLRTIKREWSVARAWLYAELTQPARHRS